ncbi:MAG TPA: tetratricopeptide repeat protein [Terriglobales bacterium]|nr:tetratricopeptide repeat protein [Terriglobales bacterium]
MATGHRKVESAGARGERPGAGGEHPPNKPILEQLARITASATFHGAGRLRRFLEFIVTEALSERKDQIKEYVVGVSVFDKPETFDPRTDPIVRVQARRLRAWLERYYREEGAGGELIIELPKGGYTPKFRSSPAAPAGTSLAAVLASRNTVVVQAFGDNSHGADLDYFCRGLHQEVVSALVKLEHVRIRALHPVGDRELGLADCGAALFVAGGVRRVGELLRVTLHLADSASGCYLWSDSIEGEATDMFGLQRQVARLLAAKVEGAVGEAPGARRGSRPAENLAARNLYLQGRYHLNQRTEEGLRKAVEFFEQAIREDPQYALAHSGLTDAYSLLGHYGVLAPGEVWTKAAANAAAAVMLDANSAEAHTSLAHVKASQDWDWAGAERQFRHAITLDPAYATAHHWLAMSCLAPMGRLQEALDEMLIAQSLDPVSAIIARDLARIYCYRREFDLALERCDHTIELNPHFAGAFCTLGFVQEQRKDFEEAIAACQRAIQLSPSAPPVHSALGHVYALAGKRRHCLEVLEKLRSLALGRYVSPMEFASLHFALRQNDIAFDWLAKACEDRSFELLTCNVDPRYDELRRDRRFVAVARNLGLTADRRRPSTAR